MIDRYLDILISKWYWRFGAIMIMIPGATADAGTDRGRIDSRLIPGQYFEELESRLILKHISLVSPFLGPFNGKTWMQVKFLLKGVLSMEIYRIHVQGALLNRHCSTFKNWSAGTVTWSKKIQSKNLYCKFPFILRIYLIVKLYRNLQTSLCLFW